MQILIGLSDLGIGVPKTSLGLGGAIGKLYFREDSKRIKESPNHHNQRPFDFGPIRA